MNLGVIHGRYFFLVFVTLAVLHVGVAPAQAQFEGVIETENITTDEVGEKVYFVMTMWIKDSLLKIQSVYRGDNPSSTMIYRNDLGVIWMLNELARSYFEIKQEGEPQNIPQPFPRDKTDQFKVTKTGKKKKILGYSCEQVILKRRGELTEIWGTKSLVQVSRSLAKTTGEESSTGSDDWNAELRKMNIFPLYASTSLDNVLVELQEVKKLDMRGLPMELFEIPQGYRKQKLDEMFDPENK